MTFEQINLLTIEPLIPLLIDRYLTRLNIEPSQEELEAEFQFYKQELIQEETDNLIEIERKSALTQRWRVLQNRDCGVPAYYQLIQTQPNAEFYMMSLINDVSKKEEAELFLQQIEAKDEEIRNERQANEYKELRRKEYPSVGDQLDMLYWDKINNTNNWEIMVNTVKAKFPKSV
jgi:hypothetical protein